MFFQNKKIREEILLEASNKTVRGSFVPFLSGMVRLRRSSWKYVSVVTLRCGIISSTMNDYAKAFKEGEREGRSDAQKEIENLRAGGELSDEKDLKLGKNVLFSGCIVWRVGFF